MRPHFMPTVRRAVWRHRPAQRDSSSYLISRIAGYGDSETAYSPHPPDSAATGSSSRVFQVFCYDTIFGRRTARSRCKSYKSDVVAIMCFAMSTLYTRMHPESGRRKCSTLAGFVSLTVPEAP